MSGILRTVAELVLTYGYITIFVGLVAENTVGLGFVIPGLFVLIAGGFAAGLGTLDAWGVFAAAYAGTLVGDNLSFALGYWGVLKIDTLRRFRGRFAELERTFIESGTWFLFVFHFPVFSRILLPPFLGAVQFRISRWLFYDSVSSFFFVLVFGGLGYGVGWTARELSVAISLSEFLQWIFLALFGLWILLIVRSYRKRHSH